MAAATAVSSPSRAILGSAFGELAASGAGSRPYGSRSLVLRNVRGNGLGKIVMTSTVPPKTETPKKFHGPTVIVKEDQVTHSITPERLEIVKSMDQWAADNLLPLLKPVEQSWQPTDYLPRSDSESFLDDVIQLRKRAAEIPDDYFVCLVGDMITEEALPTYQTMLNTMDGVRDETGASATPWAIWTRMWTAEENRHGDLLNRYLYLTGRVDMKKVEKTIQYLIGSGMNPKTENNPYLGFLYTSFQERATFISHGNTARHAKEHGEDNLAVLCGIIAADERRHEIAYSRIIEKLFELDPTGAMVGFADMMKKQIVMPAHLMYDGENPDLFNQFSAVAQRIGVYTAKDYVDIMEHLIKRWNVEKIEGMTAEGQAAQEYLCKLPPRLRRLAERAEAKAKKSEVKKANISWIFNREVALI